MRSSTQKQLFTVLIALLLVACTASAQAGATMKMESSSFGPYSLYLAVWNYSMPSITDLLGQAPLFELKVTNGFDAAVQTEFTFSAKYAGAWGEASGWVKFRPIPVMPGVQTYQVNTKDIDLKQLSGDLGSIKNGSQADIERLKEKYLGIFGTWTVADSHADAGNITVDKVINHISSGSTDFPAGVYEVTVSARYQDPVQGWLPLAEKRYSFQMMSAIGAIEPLGPLPYQSVGAEPIFRWRNPQLPAHIGYVNTVLVLNHKVQNREQEIWRRDVRRSVTAVGGREDALKFNDNNTAAEKLLIGGETYTWWVELRDVGNADYNVDGRQIQRSGTVSITLPNTPPRANITSKPTGDLQEQQAFSFAGTFSDTEDQQLDKLTTRQWYVNGKLQGTTNTDKLDYTFTTAGTYSIEYRVTDSHGAITQAYAYVNVLKNAPPEATITTPTAGKVPIGTEQQLRAQITDTDSNKVTVKWSVNGSDIYNETLSSSSSSLNQMLTSPVRLPLQSPGTYKITLTVTDANGSRTVKTVEVVAFTPQAPRVTITSPKTTQKIVLGDKVNLQAYGEDETGTKYPVTWFAYGKQWSATEVTATVPLEISQLETVLQAKATRTVNGEPYTGSAQIKITAATNQAPTVRITNPASGVQVNLNDTMRFTATATDPEGDSIQYAWTAVAPNGTRVNLGTGESIGYQLTQPGEYVIEVVAIDISRPEAYRQASPPAKVRVLVIKPAPQNSAPTVNITKPSNGAKYQAGDSINAAALATDPNGDAVYLLWRLAGNDIGPGETLTQKLGQVPDGLALDAEGYANMKLQVTASDMKGGTTQAEVTIKVKPVPLPEPTINGVNAAANGKVSGYMVGDTVNLTATMAKGTAVSYRWLLDNEEKGTGQNLSLQLKKPGLQTLLLEVNDQFGNKGQTLITLDVIANQPPQLTLESSVEGTITPGTLLVLTAKVTDPENNYGSVTWMLNGSSVNANWISGDKGQVLTFPTTTDYLPTAKEGSYIVTAQVSDNAGQNSSDATTVAVQAPRAVSVENKAPLLQIDWPRPGDPVYAGEPTPLMVALADTEGGVAKVVWLINGESVCIEAVVPPGNTFVPVRAVYTFAHAGNHPITVRVADAGGKQVEAMVTVQVQTKQEEGAVNASISKPLPNAFVMATNPVEFEAINIPAGVPMEWISDKEGSLGKSATFTKALMQQGAHKVRLLVDGHEVDYRDLTVGGNVDVRQIIGTIYKPNTACKIWHYTGTSDAMEMGRVYDIVESDFVDCGSSTVEIHLKAGNTVTASFFPQPALVVSPGSGDTTTAFYFSAANVIGPTVNFYARMTNSGPVLITNNPSTFGTGKYTIILTIHDVWAGEKDLEVSAPPPPPPPPPPGNRNVPGAVYGMDWYPPQKPPSKIKEDLEKAGVKDIKADYYAAGSITVLLESGLLAPDSDGSFNPDALVDMGVGVGIFAKVLGIASKTDSPDMALAKAQQSGIAPMDWMIASPMRRVDLARMLAIALGVQPKPYVTRADYPFTDYDAVSPEDLGILAALYELGIFKGYEDRSFRPNNVLTRAEIAIFVDRILGTH